MIFEPATIEKLGKLFPRLASDHEGEVVATVRAIQRTLAGVGHSLHDVAPAMQPEALVKVVYRDRPAESKAPPPPAKTAYEKVEDWRRIIRLADILLTECDLNNREASFIRQMRASADRLKSKFGMTEKQHDWWKSLLHDYSVFEEEA